MYAWKITEDRITDPAEDGCGLNVVGPGTITAEHERWLDTKATPANKLPEGIERFTFRLFDDDHTLYYRGVLVTDDAGTEEVCCAPLDDYGKPNAGCTSIEWDGHPEWNAE